MRRDDSNCDRQDQLLLASKERELSDQEVGEYCEHVELCPTGRHSIAATEIAAGLPIGAFTGGSVEHGIQSVTQCSGDLLQLLKGTETPKEVVVPRAWKESPIGPEFSDQVERPSADRGLQYTVGSSEGTDVETQQVNSIQALRSAVDVAQERLDAKASAMGFDNHGRQFWYRGCSSATYKLIPSLLRYPHGHKVEERLFDVYRRHQGPVALSEWNSLFEMQHHFVPTRLLDWTTKLEVALYFAFSSENLADPCVYVLHPWILNKLAGEDRVAPQLPRHKYPAEYVGNSSPHAFPLAVEPDLNLNERRRREDHRIEVQGGMFTLHGSDRSAIDDLCPEALEKIVLHMSEFDAERQTFKRTAREPLDIFPDKVGLAATLCERYQLRPSPELRIESALNTLWEEEFKELIVHGKTSRTKKFRIPGISDCVLGEEYVDRKEIAELTDWFDGPGSNPFAILEGGAGSGKTNLLLRFVQSQFKIVTSTDSQTRQILFLALNQFDPTASTLTQWMTKFVEGIPCSVQHPITEQALTKMIRSGRILVILDGLDEFARTKGEDRVHTLSDALTLLTNQGSARVIIACRDHILNRLKLEKEPSFRECKVITLARVDPEQIRRRMSSLSLSTAAIDVMTDTLLFFGVFKKVDPTSIADFSNIAGQADFFRLLIDLAKNDSGLKMPTYDLLRRLGVVATKMLERRSDSIQEKDLGSDRDIVKSLSECDCRVFTRESRDSYRFIHQAIREFTLAWNIKDALDNQRSDSVMMATHSLDYESAETYLHVRDLLGPDIIDSVVERIGSDWKRISGIEERSNFLRNYFETVAMLSVNSKPFEVVVELALGVITADEVDVFYRAKYEAARCLSRIHPNAPKPYCDWVTGQTWLKDPEFDYVYGYAARGFHLEKRRIGDRPPEPIHKERKKEKPPRHGQQVADKLLRVLGEFHLHPEVHQDALFFQVNCSHALIRWLSADYVDLVEKAKGLAIDSSLDCRIRANLFLALHECGHRPFPDIFEEVQEKPGGLRVRRGANGMPQMPQ